MSNALPPSVQSTGRSRKLTFVDDIDSKYSDYRYQSYRQPSPYTSSPPRSSSPPRTPATSSRQQSHAFIRSSPEIGLDYGFRSVGVPLVDPSSWDRRYTGSSTSLYYPAPRYASSIKSSHPPPSDFYPSSNYAISLVSEDVEQDLPELDSEPASEGTPGHSSGVFSESEEETEDDEDSMLFSSDGYRSTFFRTSAERGQWKSDPASVFKLTQQPLLQTRRSAPTQSRVTTPTLSKPRLVSEPAIIPSPLAVDTSLKVTQDRPDRTTTTTVSQEIPSPSELSPHSSQDGVDSSHTMPSLVSDRASSPGLDDLYGPLSPLPPSSPPLSPISYGAPPSRSMSVLSLSEQDPDSPFMRSSSPLSELSDDDDDDDFQLNNTTETVVSMPFSVDHDNTITNFDRGSISEPTVVSESVSLLTTESGSQAAVGHQLLADSNSVEASLSSGASCATATRDLTRDITGSVGDIIGNVAEEGSRLSSVELGHLSPSSSSWSSHPHNSTTSSTTTSPAVSAPTDASTSKCDGEMQPLVVADKNAGGNGMNSTVGCSRPVFDSCGSVASTSTRSSSATSPASAFSSLVVVDVKSKAKVDVKEKVDEKRMSMDDSRASEPRQVLQKRKKTQSVNGDADMGIDGPVKKRKVVGKDDAPLKVSVKKVNLDEVKMKTKTGISRPGQARQTSGEASEGKGKGKEVLVGVRKTSPVMSKELEKEEEEEEERATPVPKPRKRKRAEVEVEDPTMSSSGSAPKRIAISTSIPRGRVRGRKISSRSDQENQPLQAEDSEPLDEATKALHAQVFGLLIETMAMSRASSLAVSSLYKMMMQSQPGLKDQRSRKEWCLIFDRVLMSGEAGKGSGVFGKVESSGKDDSDRPLEAQWFYVPELDEDQERAALIRSMMPRPAKRSETKKYKQYYWRPLDKISKWDPEDEL